MEPIGGFDRHSLEMLQDDSFDDWFAANRDALVRYGYLCCGDPELAEDLVAEAVARVWPGWRRRRIDNLDGYVRRTMTNALTDRRRRRAIAQRTMARERLGGATPDPAGPAADRTTIWPLVLGLPPKQRAVIVLRYFEGRSEAEIAQLLDISPGTVKSRASRALDALRTRLEEPVHG